MTDARGVAGRFEILREIGRGGMATVWLARQTDLDRLVALKELPALLAADPELVERFVRESRLAGQLSHPNIVTVHEYFVHNGTPYIVMEYLPRGPLGPLIGKLSLAEIAGTLEGLLAGLAHAHLSGIVHRDLKPPNLLVTHAGSVKITDFGIAKAYQASSHSLTATGMTLGTPAYMAPEQAMGQPVGPWTDLYSTGAIAYELFVGRTPFHDAETPMSMLMRHVQQPIPAPREVRPDLDPALADWLERMLAKAPEERPPDALRAWEALEEIIVGTLSPLWRREARLPDLGGSDETAEPLTPARFDEEEVDDGFVTVRRPVIGREPPPPPLPQPPPQQEPPPPTPHAPPPPQPPSRPPDPELTAPPGRPMEPAQPASRSGYAPEVPLRRARSGSRRLWFALAIIAAIAFAAVGVAAITLVGSDGGDGGPEVTPKETTPIDPPAARRIQPRSIAASATSVLPPTSRFTYDAENTLDGEPRTAWNADDTTGEGEVLTYDFGRPVRLVRVDILNGYVSTEESYFENARLKDVTLLAEDEELRWTLDDAGDWEQAQRWQRISEDLGTTSQLQLRIESVYEGTDWNESGTTWNDAALSEIRFWELPTEEAK